MERTAELGVMAGILVPIAMFAMIFGIVYLAKRERLAMIERGMDPRRYKPQSAPFRNLKWGLLLIGAGAGLFLAYIFDNYILHFRMHYYDHGDSAPIYFSLIAIGGGLGLFWSYKLEKKWMDEKTDTS